MIEAKNAIKKVAHPPSKFQKDVRMEFRKQMFTAIAGALAFIMALSWREPIEVLMQQLVKSLGLPADGIYPKLFTAVIITIIAAVVLVILSHWMNKPEEKK